MPEPATDSPQAETSSIPDWQQKQGIPFLATETRYWYSKTQWVSRFEWKNSEGIKTKTIRQGHIKTNGLIQWQKGSKDWRAYKLTEAVKYCQNKWVLGVEGEGCVETARAKAIAGVTWQGSNWEVSRIVTDLTILILKDTAPHKKIEAEEQQRSVNLPNWTQSDLADWLGEKYRGKLAWNTDSQDWYRYSSVTRGIWSIEASELIGQSVKSELKAIANQIAKVKKKKPSYTISMINKYD